MPYKDPEQRRAYKRAWERRRRQTNPEKTREKWRRWYRAHPEYKQVKNDRYREADAARQRRRYKEDPERGREASRRYRAANPEAVRASEQRYRRANADKIRERERRYRQANREKIRAKDRRWREANPEKLAERDAHHQNRRRALKAGVPSERWTTAEIVERDGWQCQVDDCRHPGGRAIDPDAEYRWRATVDHVRPISKGGADLKGNLQAAHQACNSAKNNLWENDPF
jgi:5-methylcytosine-specific restriction endonuclease McrA